MDVEMVYKFSGTSNPRRFILVFEETFLGGVCIHTYRAKTRSCDVGI
jgi:hypothetical protein